MQVRNKRRLDTLHPLTGRFGCRQTPNYPRLIPTQNVGLSLFPARLRCQTQILLDRMSLIRACRLNRYRPDF
jgi:hypothetical protein